MKVLFHDEHYVAIDKPSGLLVHRQGDRREAAALQRLRDQIGQRVYPVHRLDRSTSGVLAFGITPEAASRLAALFSARTVDKRYLAVVRGVIAPVGEIDYPLVDEQSGVRKAAQTRFVRVDTTEIDEPVHPHPSARYSLVALHPASGRTHQLRRHMAHLRHPIVGDVRHGDGRHNRLFRSRFGAHRLLLWATRLSFRHPFTGRQVEVSTPPADAAFFTALGWGAHAADQRSAAAGR